MDNEFGESRRVQVKDVIDRLPTRSDDLATLREVFDALPLIANHLTRPESARLVIDANVAISEVRWMVTKRSKPEARTSLQEAIASKTVVAFAPSYLEDEMQAKLAVISGREGIPLEPLLSAWREYRAGIRFYAASRPTSAIGTPGIADPKDVPYIETYSAVGAAAILTDDPHLERMGARTIRFEMTVAMRSYARHASVELTLKWHGMLLLTLGIAAIGGFVGAVRGGARLVAKAPRGIQLLIGVAVLGALLHRPTRERLVNALGKGWEALLVVGKEIVPLVADLTIETKRAERGARAAWNRLGPHATPRQVPLRTHVLAICASVDTPLSTQQIALEAARSGVNVKAKTFPQYLRRVLRTHPGLREVEPNRWSVIPPTG